MALLVDSFNEVRVLGSAHVITTSFLQEGMTYGRELIEPCLHGHKKFVDPVELPVVPLRSHLYLLIYP